MKRSLRHHQQWLLRQRKKKESLRRSAARRQTHRRRNPRAGIGLTINRHNPEQQSPKNRRVVIELPEILDLDEHREATITNLSNVRSAHERGLKIGMLSFDRLRRISPSAALMLASEIDRWNDAVGGRLKAKHENWDPAVRSLLAQMGFFELLHKTRPAEVASAINTSFLPFIRGNVEDKSAAGQLAVQLRKQIEEVSGLLIRKHLLFDGLTEAITNVSQHAYDSTAGAKLRPWWMSAAYMRRTNTVVVSFYDHGKTIPKTLPASKIFELMKATFGAWNDGQKLRAAMELGRTSSGGANRGKGLQNFLEIIKEHDRSRLRIFSNRGILAVSKTQENTLMFDSSTLENCLKGTLIEWQFVPKK